MEGTTQRRVELYVRSLAPCGTSTEQNEVVERLHDLDRRDVVDDDVDLTVWGDAVCLDGASATVGTGRQVADRVREFYGWCADGPTSLDPFFTWSTVESSLSGDSFRRVVLPSGVSRSTTTGSCWRCIPGRSMAQWSRWRTASGRSSRPRTETRTRRSPSRRSAGAEGWWGR